MGGGDLVIIYYKTIDKARHHICYTCQLTKNKILPL